MRPEHPLSADAIESAAYDAFVTQLVALAAVVVGFVVGRLHASMMTTFLSVLALAFVACLLLVRALARAERQRSDETHPQPDHTL